MKRIITKKDLKDYIACDKKRINDIDKDYIIDTEIFAIIEYLSCLRHVEYHLNNKGILHKIQWSYYWLKLRKMSIKYNLYIAPNTCGKGLLITGLGFLRIDSFSHIGDNCTIEPMVLFGKKKPKLSGCFIKVGDNCKIGYHTIILTNCEIGNNVTILPYSVVNKDIPDNSTIQGVPAKIVS